MKELSAEMLNSYSTAELSTTPIPHLEDIRGVSEVKAGQLKAASDLPKRLQRGKKVYRDLPGPEICLGRYEV